MAWDPGFPPARAALFDAVLTTRKATPKGKIAVGPGVLGAGPIWLDGRIGQLTGETFDVEPGVHLLQVLQPTVTTLEVVVDPGRPVAVLAGSALDDTVALGVTQPTGRVLLDALLYDIQPGRTVAYVWTGVRTWRDNDGWEELPQAPLERARARRALGRTLTGGGIALLGFGVASGVVGLVAYLDAAGEPARTDADRWTQRQAMGVATGLWGAGLAAAGSGGAILAVGVPLSRASTQAQGSPLAGGGLGVTVSWTE